MNNFDNLASLALDEASLGDYMKAVKATAANAARSTAKVARAATHGAAAATKLAGNVVQGAGQVYSALGGTQGGAMLQKVGSATANAAGKVVTSMQELGATAQEEEIMRKLYGENPMKGDPIKVELPGIEAPNAYIRDTKPGTKEDTIYTVELFPMGKLTSFKLSSQSANSVGLTPDQKAIQAIKAKSPVDELSFTKGNKNYGSTNVTLSLYKNKKLVAARNIPGLKDSGGLHFNGDGQPWTLNSDSSDSIDFSDIAAMVANDKSLNLDTKQISQVVATTNYPQLKQVLTKFGKGDLYMKAYTNAATALRQGKTPPTAPTAAGNNETSTPGDQTKGINARTLEGNPVTGQTRYTTADKKKTYLYGKGGWKQYDPNTKKWSPPIQQQAQITAAWQKSQNIKPIAASKPVAASPRRATKGETKTKTGAPVDQYTAADVASMNLPSHPLTSRTPPNRRR